MAADTATSVDKRLPSLEIVLGLLPLLLGFQLLAWTIYLPSAVRGNADFRAYYAAGYLLKSGYGHQLYDFQLQKTVQDNLVSRSSTLLPYIHPAYETLLFAPLALLPYKAAYFVLLGINLVCFLAAYRLLRRKLWRLNQIWHWFPVLLMFSFTPTAAGLMAGQDSPLLLLLLATVLTKLEAGKHLESGLLLGLAMFRFQVVFPIVLLFLLWRRWHFVEGVGLSSAVILILSILLSGIDGLKLYLRALYGISVQLTKTGQSLYGIPVARMPNLRGLFFVTLHPRSDVSLLVLCLVIIAFATWAGRRASVQCQVALAIACAPLVGYHIFTHDLSIIFIPVAVLVNEANPTGLWNIPCVWFLSLLCFLGYDYLVAVPLLLLFVSLARRTMKRLGDGGRDENCISEGGNLCF